MTCAAETEVMGQQFLESQSTLGGMAAAGQFRQSGRGWRLVQQAHCFGNRRQAQSGPQFRR